MLRLIAIALVSATLAGGASAAGLDGQAVNDARLTGKSLAADRVDPLAVKAQVLLDRARFSPGEIDGRRGENFEKALRAFAEAKGLAPDGKLSAELLAKLSEGGKPAIIPYVVTKTDLRGPFLAKLPAKMEAMKSLPHLGYTTPREALAEKFHMSEALLVELNPGKRFDRAGETLNVANVRGDEAKPPQVSRIEVDKQRQTIKAFGKGGELLAFDPATIGSDEKPTPSGTLKVVSVDRDPTYRYDPAYKFKGVKSREPFRIKPGPNNPVGTVWIGLSEQGYGIHGTPAPSKVSKAESHGCVRLTNWDAERLAAMVTKGVVVTFVDENTTADAKKSDAKKM